jgi:hypothetical protein
MTTKMAEVTGLMNGKRGLVMGVANDHSIAWGIARALSAHGAEMAFTYQGEALGKRVRPLANSVNSSLVLPCDVEDLASVDAVFAALSETWGTLDFVVHCIGYSDRNELKGRYADTSRENFVRTMVISAFSFTEIAKRAAALMPNGGAMLTLTFGGATRVMPNYNVMGVAKAALERALSRGGLRTRGHSRQRHLGRSSSHLGGRRHHRRSLHVQLPARPLPPPTYGYDRRRRRVRALPALGAGRGRHWRNPFCRFGI